jgi:hypothetical protein
MRSGSITEIPASAAKSTREQSWRRQRDNMGSGLTSAQRAAFDDLLFDQMANLIYTHKALSTMNPCFREESVLPLLLQVRAVACLCVCACKFVHNADACHTLLHHCTLHVSDT